MVQLALGLFGLGGAGGAAAGTAGAAAGAAGAAGAALSGGSIFTTLLQGGATLLGMMSTIEAGDQEADMLEAKAIDAQAEKPLETLQSISRRTSIKQELAEAVGEQEVAFAASGVDLSFGTPAVAKKDAFREADRALTNENATEETTLNRLDERSSQYRLSANRARSSARRQALLQGLSFGLGALGRG
ncbi:hypothetical protein [Roseibium album]|uniref:hypothetical protein n=1 Tax=Roseibium album TaxID=311410 RepID=UPI002493758D|nr:hypothetical protein [Roseibium album]